NDLSGEINQSSNSITVTPVLKFTSFTANVYTISTGQSVGFTNTTSGGTGSNKYSYTVNDMSGVAITGNSITFDTAGNYLVALQVSDLSGETNTTNTIITVTPPLEIQLFVNKTPISAGQWVKFTNTTSGGTGSNQYSYTFACDGAVQNETNGNVWQFNVASEEPCTATIHVNDLSGEINQSSNSITVTPVLKFTSFTNTTTNTISADQSVTFANTTTGGTGSNQYTYFINGIKTNVLNNTIAFTTQGVYNVSLGVKDLSGEIANASQTVNVSAPLNVIVYSNWSTISADQFVKFWNTTSGGTGSNKFSQYTVNGLLSFPGVIQNGNVLQFTIPGNYYVGVTQTDKSGEVAVSNVLVTVTPALKIALAPNLTAILNDQSVFFTNITSGGTGGNTYSYTVNAFSNTVNYGNTGYFRTGNIFTFHIPAFGKTFYNVTIHVVDRTGEVNQSSALITVDEPLTLNVSITSTPLVSQDQRITLKSTGAEGGVPPYTYVWNESYGPLSSPVATSFVIPPNCEDPASLICSFMTNSSTPTGHYWFTLFATDNEPIPQTVESPQFEITVDPALTVNSFYATPNMVNVGQTVSLLNQTSGGTGRNIYTYNVISGPAGGSTANIVNSSKYAFTMPGNYVIEMHVSDKTGENANATTNVMVFTPITLSMAPNKTTISADQSILFTNTTSGGMQPYSYAYTVNGIAPPTSGVTQSGNVLTFAQTGNYLIALTVTDKNGNTGSANTVITVTPALTAQLIPNRTSISPDQSVKFTNATSGGTGGNVYTYTINNTNGVTQTGNVFTFADSGKYNVTLTVNDISGEVAASNSLINVTAALTTQLFANRTPISAGQSVSFTNATSGGTGSNSYQYTVDPADCASASELNGSIFTFPSAGNCNVTLHVTDKSGEVATSNSLINITPVLEITLIPNRTSISAGQNVSFTNTTTGGTGGNTYSYTVICESESEAPYAVTGNIITFTAPAGCEVTIHVKDLTGETNSSSAIIDVSPQLETQLFANRMSISAGQNVSFTNDTTGGTGSNTYSYTVDPAECASASELNGSIFTFPSAGNCTVTLHVSDLSGEIANSSVSVNVTPQLEIQLYPRNKTLEAGESINFTNTTIGGTGSNQYSYITQCNAEEGYSQNGNEIKFNTPETCTVKLTATDRSGEVANSTSTITVVQPLNITLRPLLTVIDAGQTATFTNTTTGGVPPYSLYRYTVNSTGGVGIVKNTVAFAHAGNYLITENVIDSINDNATSNPVIVHVNPAIQTQVPTVSNIIVDQGQFETVNDSATGGTPPYTFLFTITNETNGNVIHSFNATGVNPNQVVSFTYNTMNVPVLNDELGNLNVTLKVTDSLGVVVASTNKGGIIANPPLDPSVISSVGTPDIGQLVNFTTQIHGGSAPYLYAMIITNPSGNVIATQGVITDFQTPIFQFTPSANAVGTDNVLIGVTDSATTNEIEFLSTSIDVQNVIYVPPVTTTVPQGGGGGGGGGSSGPGVGGGGGGFKPTVLSNGNCTTILNFTQDNSETLSILNNTFDVTENYITPTTAGISVNGNVYELGVGQSLPVGKIGGVDYTVELTNLSYLPIMNTVTVVICGSGPVQTPLVAPNTTNNSTVKPPITTVKTTIATTTVPQGSHNQTDLAKNNTKSNGGNNGSLPTADIISLMAIILAILAAIVFGGRLIAMLAY
ncbi:MAG: hypothetical protein KGH67_03515, partial [Candidatus Micrarchaeota archaeon]|nr:hypothetical protein [Candidatus Micrarchaeota archaeon]